MSNPYDFDYCCTKLEKFGRDIRDRIQKEMPVIFRDLEMMRFLLDLLPTDMDIRGIQVCPFCHTPIEETLENIEIQWHTRFPETKSSKAYRARLVNPYFKENREAL